MIRHPRLVFFTAITLFASILVLNAANRGRPQENRGRGGSIHDLPEVKDRTSQRLREMSPRQRKHAEHFRGQFKSSTKLLDALASVRPHVEFFGEPGRPVRSAEAVVREAACAADAVFAVQIETAEAHPVEDGTFLFTEYVGKLGTVFRLSPRTPTVQQGNSVTIVRPGGRLVVDGAKVEAVHSMFPLLEEKHLYLLFTRYLPATDAFSATNLEGTFEIRGAHTVSLGPIPDADHRIADQGLDSRALIETLRGLSCK